MATLKRDQILAALAAALGVERNDPLGDLDAGASVRSLYDGDTELVDEFINPPIYEWTMTPSLLLAVQGADDTSPDAALTALIEAAATACAAVTDLGGLITAIRVQAPDFEPKMLWGRPGMKGAELPIEIDYWSETSLG